MGDVPTLDRVIQTPLLAPDGRTYGSFAQPITLLSDGRLAIYDYFWKRICIIQPSGIGSIDMVIHENSWRFVALPNMRLAIGVSKELRIWNIQDKTYERILHGHTENILCVTVLRNGNIVSGSSDWTIRIWNPETGECIRKIITWSISVTWQTRIYYIAELPDGRISSAGEHTVCIWNSSSNIPDVQWKVGGGNTIGHLIALPDGNLIVSTFASLYRLRLSGGKEEYIGSHVRRISCLAQLSDGRIVSGSEDIHEIRVWNLTKKHPIVALDRYYDTIQCPSPPLAISIANAMFVFCKYHIAILNCKNAAKLMRDIPEGSENAEFLNDIKEGDAMVNFPRNSQGLRTNYNYRTYHKNVPQIRSLLKNPTSRLALRNINFQPYFAHIVKSRNANSSKSRTRKIRRNARKNDSH